jgi:GNAT superfamily N-acetyltransferase
MTRRLGFDRVLFRRAGTEDQTALVDFRLAMLVEIAQTLGRQPVEQTAAIREANETWLRDHLGRDLVAWFAEIDGRPVATAALMWFAHPPGPADPGGREGYVLNVYTRPEARRMGLARALMDRLVDEARSVGVRRIWLRTSPEAKALYVGMGFVSGDYLQLILD